MKPNGRRANKPFTARSLVGMSAGARKRTARRFECPGCMECGGLDKPKLEPWRCYGEDIDLGNEQWRPYNKCPNMRRLYQQHRAKYRIGERLRPCPGCWHCQTTWQQSSIYPHTAVMHRHGCSHDDPSGLCCFGETVPVKMECDGSGVLPARKKP